MCYPIIREQLAKLGPVGVGFVCLCVNFLGSACFMVTFCVYFHLFVVPTGAVGCLEDLFLQGSAMCRVPTPPGKL